MQINRLGVSLGAEITGVDLADANADCINALRQAYEFTYRHQWRLRDLVIWDNRCTLHYAIHDHGDAPRVMHRTTVVGDDPR